MSGNRTFDYAFFYKRRQDLVNSRNQYLNNVNGQRIIYNTQLSDWNASRQATFAEGATTMVFRGTYGNGKIISPGGIINIPPYPQELEVVITAPSAPTITSIDSGNQQLTVNFTPPTSNGGGDITDYEYSTDNGSNWISAGITISPFTISSLAIGTTYDVKIKAVNSAGAGPESNMVQGNTWNVPSAPTITSITSGDQQLTVNFTAPTSDGGAAITDYEYSLNGESFSAGQTTSPITITGLTNGQSYEVRIIAVNAVGTGELSNMVLATPATTPSAPTITSITSGDQQLTVNFTAPTSDGGSAITNYIYSTNGGTSFTPFSPADTTSPVVITGLTNGTSYSVVIRAVNSINPGAQSNAISATPSAPTPGDDLIIASLTTSLSAYNSANIGDWVSITSTEWNNLKTNVTGTVTTGASDTMMTTATNFGGGLTNAPSSAIVTNMVEAPRSSGIPANSYIYGFSVRFRSNLGTSFGVFANTSTTSNTGFNQLGNLISSLINGTNYLVRKGVSDTNGGTAGLIGFFTGTKLDYPSGTFPGSAAYVGFIGDNNTANPLIRWKFFNDSTIPTSSTVLDGSLNNYGTFCIQALTTPTKQWN
jgi:hypothetical protein